MPPSSASHPVLRRTYFVSPETAQKVRALAHRQRTSNSAIIELALWYFFRNSPDKQLGNLMRDGAVVSTIAAETLVTSAFATGARSANRVSPGR